MLEKASVPEGERTPAPRDLSVPARPGRNQGASWKMSVAIGGFHGVALPVAVQQSTEALLDHVRRISAPSAAVNVAAPAGLR